MDKENVVCTYNGILFSLNKNGDPAICGSIDEPEGHDADWNEPDTERQIPNDFAYMWNLK